MRVHTRNIMPIVRNYSRVSQSLIADLKNRKHIPMSPKDGITVEKLSLAVLAVLGVVGLAYFIATALEVLPIISAS